MSIFETVKDIITTRQAAERYGLKVNHSGMCKCPFHNDRNPSMKLYEKRFHCFGCQADGDVISFAARLFNLTPKEAALKLAEDFGIQYDSRQKAPYVRRRTEISNERIQSHRVSYCFNELANYRNLLIQWLQQYAPKSPDKEPHPRFLEALHNLNYVEYQLDVLLSGEDHEKEYIVNDYFNKKQNNKEVSAVEPAVNTPVYHESAAYAREHGELDLFRQSHQANIACKKDIEEAISKNFDGMRLNKRAVTEVLEKYGPERVGLVLAATVQTKEWDGRFSPTNKDWAFTFDFPDTKTAHGFDRRDDYAVTSHPAVLDGFITGARNEIREIEHPAEKKYAVLLTDSQDVKVLECDPQEEMFSIARGTLGCEWIELVEPESLASDSLLMLIDEEGKMKEGEKLVNCVASDLYGSDRHGDPIVGSAMIVRSADEQLELLTKAEAEHLASGLEKKRGLSIEKISKAFGLRPIKKEENEVVSPVRRQTCGKDSMER